MQSLTRTGEVFGSPLYMSPEQCNGARVDHRADVYSLGCVFFEALTGAPPCAGENALSTMMKHQTEQVLTLKQASLGAEFPQALEDIVATTLEKSPDNRYQNLGILAHDLGALRRGAPISAAGKVSRIEKEKDRTVSMSSNKFYALMIGITVTAGAVGYGLHTSGARARLESSGADQAPKDFKGDLPRATVAGELSKKAEKEPDITNYQVLTEVALKQKLASPTVNNKFALSNRTISDRSFELISETSWIQHLALRNCEISNASLARLAKLNLIGFTICGSNFEDGGAAKLSACQSLQNIDASMTGISDEGVSRLCRIKSLKSLVLYGTNVTDKAFVALAQAKQIESLSLENTKQITNNGLSVLPHGHLQHLFLADTSIDDDGAAYISKIKTLRTVALSGTKVTVDGVRKLLRASKINRIYLARCPNIDQKEFERLRSQFYLVAFSDKDSKDRYGVD